MKGATTILTIALALMWNVATDGHHSIEGTFQLDRSVPLQGTITMITIRNPHSFISNDCPYQIPHRAWNYRHCFVSRSYRFWGRSNASNLSGGLKRPRRKVGGVMVTSASSFSDGSART